MSPHGFAAEVASFISWYPEHRIFIILIGNDSRVGIHRQKIFCEIQYIINSL
jgi:hypothetical protein